MTRVLGQVRIRIRVQTQTQRGILEVGRGIDQEAVQGERVRGVIRDETIHDGIDPREANREGSQGRIRERIQGVFL